MARGQLPRTEADAGGTSPGADLRAAVAAAGEGRLAGSGPHAEDFDALLAQLPAGDAVHRTAEGRWGLSRHADVAAVLRDPPHHARRRDAVAHAFTRPAVDALWPRIQAHADALPERAELLLPCRHAVLVEDVELFTCSAEPVLPPGVVFPGHASRLTS
jgi:cytochrome P450